MGVKAARSGPAAAAPLDTPVSGTRPEFPACARDCHLRAEADHRIANQLTLLASYARMRGADFDGDGVASHSSVRLFIHGVEAQIRAVARLHRLLTSHAGTEAVDLAPMLHEICAPFAEGPEPRVVLIEDLEAGCSVSADHVLSVGQIVGEAIINAMKYAFTKSGVGALLVRAKRDGQGGVCIEVIDYGPGFPADFDAERDGGFGLKLMRSMSRGMGAALRFDSSPKGLRVSLTLPDAGLGAA